MCPTAPRIEVHTENHASRIPRIPRITVLNPVPRNVRIPMREPCRHPIFTLRLFENFLSKIACGTMWQSFLKNAGTACGKRDNCPFRNGFHVPGRLGTSPGLSGTNLGHAKVRPVFAILTISPPARCPMGQRDKKGHVKPLKLEIQSFYFRSRCDN